MSKKCKKLLEDVLPLNIIREVEKWPVLYARDCPERANARFRQKIWHEVARGIFAEWDSYSNHEKDNKASDLQKKWRNLRDTFKRELELGRKAGEGGRNVKKKEYVYFKYMAFLLPHMVEPEAEADADGDMGAAADDSPPPYGKKERYSPPTTRTRPPKKKRRSIADIALVTASDPVVEMVDIDEDKHFLMSLIPSFKRMSDHEKLTAKVEILKVIKKVRGSAPAASLEQFSYGGEVDALPYGVVDLDPHVKTEMFAAECAPPTLLPSSDSDNGDGD
ncbi:hypothetical protein K1T71_011991 [Dendrolimus kikuchii]|uniref:Uncharacterized protein n=1 Tax=Dendrolimus kikuchii TaxID=765133 RepID=A0ACC1CKE4_9NEOP|nr:hypothetical protein K1T71_011991 [Dendrolimus kikuchii]